MLCARRPADERPVAPLVDLLDAGSFVELSTGLIVARVGRQSEAPPSKARQRAAMAAELEAAGYVVLPYRGRGNTAPPALIRAEAKGPEAGVDMIVAVRAEYGAAQAIGASILTSVAAGLEIEAGSVQCAFSVLAEPVPVHDLTALSRLAVDVDTSTELAWWWDGTQRARDRWLHFAAAAIPGVFAMSAGVGSDRARRAGIEAIAAAACAACPEVVLALQSADLRWMNTHTTPPGATSRHGHGWRRLVYGWDTLPDGWKVVVDRRDLLADLARTYEPRLIVGRPVRMELRRRVAGGEDVDAVAAELRVPPARAAWIVGHSEEEAVAFDARTSQAGTSWSDIREAALRSLRPDPNPAAAGGASV